MLKKQGQFVHQDQSEILQELFQGHLFLKMENLFVHLIVMILQLNQLHIFC